MDIQLENKAAIVVSHIFRSWILDIFLVVVVVSVNTRPLNALWTEIGYENVGDRVCCAILTPHHNFTHKTTDGVKISRQNMCGNDNNQTVCGIINKLDHQRTHYTHAHTHSVRHIIRDCQFQLCVKAAILHKTWAWDKVYNNTSKHWQYGWMWSAPISIAAMGWHKYCIIYHARQISTSTMMVNQRTDKWQQ